MPEIVGTFLRTELRDEGADGAVKAWDGSRCHFTQECLEFAVRHLDGIEVGRIFRQVTQCRAHCFDSPANAGPQMDPAVIHHDDVVASERRNQAVFDIGEEHLSGHGTFDHHRGDHFIVTQSGHEGDRLPSSKRNGANHPDATRGSPSQSHHVRADGGLVDKHQPRHCAEAGQVEKAVGLWAKAGQRSFERSALMETVDQFRKALELIAALPPTPALRRERMNVQAALITPLMHVKGHSAPETRAAAEEARRLIEEAEALGEAPEDPLLLLSVLYGVWMANWAAFNRDTTKEVAEQFYRVAEKLGTSAALLAGHRVMGSTFMLAGELVVSRLHFDQAVALYDPAEHRPLAARFGLDLGAAVLCHRSLALLWQIF